MRKQLLVLSFILVIICSCKKAADVRYTLSGLYTEESPLSGRSQLNFISKDLVVKTEAGSNVKDTFHFEVSVGKIEFTPVNSNQSSVLLDFNRIDNTSFDIENLYPSSSSTESFMIFKK